MVKQNRRVEGLGGNLGNAKRNKIVLFSQFQKCCCRFMKSYLKVEVTTRLLLFVAHCLGNFHPADYCLTCLARAACNVVRFPNCHEASGLGNLTTCNGAHFQYLTFCSNALGDFRLHISVAGYDVQGRHTGHVMSVEG